MLIPHPPYDSKLTTEIKLTKQYWQMMLTCCSALHSNYVKDVCSWVSLTSFKTALNRKKWLKQTNEQANKNFAREPNERCCKRIACNLVLMRLHRHALGNWVGHCEKQRSQFTTFHWRLISRCRVSMKCIFHFSL